MTASQPCTPGGATSEGVSCTYVGATSRDNLAPFFVQHRSLNLVPPSVQDTLHPRWFNNEYPYLLTQPVMHFVQDGRSTYRNSSTTTLDLPDQRGNHQTACAERGVTA
jgi:hypothetical protein